MSKRIKMATSPCETHKMMNQVLGYIAHHDWMKEQGKKGLKQKQCPDCGRYLFPSEV